MAAPKQNQGTQKKIAGDTNASFEEYMNARGLEIRRNGVVVNDPYSDPWAR